jgi:hypothetical protein
MLWCDRYGSDKKRVGTRYGELEFLHPMGSVSHIVQSGASGARNINALFLMLGWDWYRYDKSAPGHVTSKLCVCIWWDLQVTWSIPVHLGHKTSMQSFSCSGGLGVVSLKSAPGHITPN